MPFHVALGADKEKVREAVIEAAREVPFTLADTEDRRTQVWLVGYGRSSLNFELIVWPKLDAVKRPKAMIAAYTWAIDDALRKARVEIPIPQRDIRVRAIFGEEGDAARDTLRLERSRPSYEAAAHTTVNDAAEDLLRADPPEDEPENPRPADAAR
ncbi:MAG: hypothetical protein NVV62_01660 [Terricaulis sp.]|nr:hypothetical protein [Terricaulis sp.]